MPSAGRTSMPRIGPAPRMFTVETTLRVAGSIVTIVLPSTRPTMRSCASAAAVVMRADAARMPAPAMVLRVPNIDCSLLRCASPDRSVATAGSYGSAPPAVAGQRRIFDGADHETVKGNGLTLVAQQPAAFAVPGPLAIGFPLVVEFLAARDGNLELGAALLIEKE